MVIDPVTGTLIGQGISMVTGLFSGGAEKREANRQRKLQQQQIDANWDLHLETRDRDWKRLKADYRHIKQGVNIARENEERLASWRDQTNEQDYQYRLKIQDFEYNQQVREFNKSEELYKMQRGFNAQAAAAAATAENRRLQEVFQEAAFDNQDLLVKMLQEEGNALARGVSGNSAGRVLQTAAASYGRNQAIVAESLVSAERQSKSNLRDIDLQRYGADLQAEGNRKLRPDRLPSIPKPLATPRAVFQSPRKLNPKYDKAPRGKKGINAAPRASNAGLISTIGQGIAGMASTYSDYRSQQQLLKNKIP